MFGDLNRVELLGNITSDLNMRTITNGTNVVSFGIATNRRYKQNDEWKDQTDFHNVVVWGKQAEGLSTRARKELDSLYQEDSLQGHGMILALQERRTTRQK